MSLAFWICAAVTTLSALVGLVYSVLALRAAKGDARTTAMYAFARSAALAVAAIVALFATSVPFEAAVAIAMVIVQGIDSGIGVALRERARTFGPAVVAILNLGALIWMLAS